MINFESLTFMEWTVVALGYLAVLLTSGLPVGYVISYIEAGDSPEQSDRLSRAGRVVGKCENVLVLTFVFLGAYVALAVIFAAEGLVTRAYDEEFDPMYVLAGTLVNFTYSLLFAYLIVGVIQLV